MDATLRLTDVRGGPVFDTGGRRLGRVADLAVDHGERFPLVTAVAIIRGRKVVVEPWSAVMRVGAGDIVLAPTRGEPPIRDLYLSRDLLDAQVVDIAGRRLARVGEIELALRGTELRAVAVDVGLAPVARRLGLRRLARRLPSEIIGWDGVHFATGRGHHVQLASPAAAIHRLDPRELMEVVARLPPERAAEVLHAVPSEHAARAVQLPRPPARRRFHVLRARKRAPS
jgi:sporulation protein YlmC with PRC-barrel domain